MKMALRLIASVTCLSLSAGVIAGPFAGVYDATRDGDVNYLIIDSENNIRAYNYLGDGVDAGNNCYAPVTAGGINSGISGKKAVYDSLNATYSVTSSSGEQVSWLVSSPRKVTLDVGFKLSSGGQLSVNSTYNGVLLNYVLSANPTGLSPSDVETALCTPSGAQCQWEYKETVHAGSYDIITVYNSVGTCSDSTKTISRRTGQVQYW